MPTYAYACTNCGHRFDAVQSFSDPALTDCPQCQGPLRKEYGSIGVTFKGSGFYRTDARSTSSDASSSASSGDVHKTAASLKAEAPTASPAAGA